MLCVSAQYETGMEKSKLFINGLAFEVTKEELHGVFSKVRSLLTLIYTGSP